MQITAEQARENAEEYNLNTFDRQKESLFKRIEVASSAGHFSLDTSYSYRNIAEELAKILLELGYKAAVISTYKNSFSKHTLRVTW